jgi:hypothetical protein
MGKIVARLPEDVKIGPDVLLLRSAGRDHTHTRQRQSDYEDQESPPLHRFAISTTRLSMAANMTRLDCAWWLATTENVRVRPPSSI